METSISLPNTSNTAGTSTSGLPCSSESSSRSSRRSTSPHSVEAAAAVVVDISPRSYQPPSPLIDLSVISDISIEHTPNTLLDFPPANMDRSPFQSVNDRRSKLVSERVNLGQHQSAQQQQQQPRLLQSQLVNMGLQAPPQSQLQSQSQPQALHTRGLSSANWRAHRTEDIPVAQSQHMYNVYDTYNPQYQGNRVMMHPNIRADQHHYFQHVGVTPFPNSGAIAESQLDGSYAYCYDRGNGQYTRLIPADMLPPLQDIPALQQGSAGMLVIPQPRGLPPNGHSSNTERVAIRSNPAHPNSSSDTIQSRIDNIVAATPSTPTHAGTSGLGSTSSSGAPSNQRRPKVYCDKWVHEGTCAFTQQGCKYKHEMPSDKVTQHQLGLFHGYPQWWKKHQADLARQRETPLDSPSSDAGGSNLDSRSNTERYLGRTAASSGGGLGPARDAGGQIGWRSTGEYSADPQTLGSPPPTVRSILPTSSSMGIPPKTNLTVLTSNPVSTLAGYSGPHATTIDSSDTNLSRCPASYGSLFGPIAPPARNNATIPSMMEVTRGSPGVQPMMKSQNTSQNLRVNLPSETKMGTSSKIPTSNPYASLDTLDSSGDKGATQVNGPDNVIAWI